MADDDYADADDRRTGQRTRISILVKEDPDIGFVLELDPKDEGKGIEVEGRQHVIKAYRGEHNPYDLHLRLEPPAWKYGSPALVWFPPPQKFVELSGDPMGNEPITPEAGRRNVRVPVNAADTTGETVSFDFFLFIEDTEAEVGRGETVLVRPPQGTGFEDPTIVLNPPPP